jgi:hypothetical protein
VTWSDGEHACSPPSVSARYEGGHTLGAQLLAGPVTFQPFAVHSAIWMQLTSKFVPYWHATPAPGHAEPCAGASTGQIGADPVPDSGGSASAPASFDAESAPESFDPDASSAFPPQAASSTARSAQPTRSSRVMPGALSKIPSSVDISDFAGLRPPGRCATRNDCAKRDTPGTARVETDRDAGSRRIPMKREKQLTKRERKAANGAGPSGNNPKEAQHIHCVACGRHIEPSEFHAPATARRVACQHRSQFPSCVACLERTTALLAEHDRTGQPVKTAAAWH